MSDSSTLALAPATDLIPVQTTNDGSIAVMGRDLHTFLEVKDNYTDWMKRMIAYGFSAGQDFSEFSDKPNGAGRPRIDHIISLDMAKEISMIQRTEKGKQARQYFIECEKQTRQAHALPSDYASALRELAATVEVVNQQKAELEQVAPIVDYHETFIEDDDLLSLRTVARTLEIGEHALRELLIERRWIYRQTIQEVMRSGRVRNRNRYCEYDRYQHYFRRVHHHDVPKFKGEVMFTLKVTPAGAAAIARLLDRIDQEVEVA